MNSTYLDSVADRQWHAVDGDRVVGRAEVLPRPGGRLFLGIDSWHDEVFEQLVEVVKAELPRPRYEVEATAGWDSVPAEVLAWADRPPLPDPLKYYVAALGEEYVGLARVVPLRQPRIGLVAVRAGQRRRGIGRALLASVFGALYHAGITTASGEVDESGDAALTLFEGIGASWTSGTRELVLPGTPNA
ncbi:GNAT family N-acetyltransferase [Amycolatopsis panacis]|uniref:GNAT family N-acetyltransferase n=1 Tax=Amycolatopsis panacis TaxID=2340917 RepID=A0A419IAC0_9PSEU|nr:GNAT family N-acetyltransferase [Amycolatopsis panacis]RJQ90419.1 GNAT family N-acetyltransferase [Amycolatopsis panacis]